MSTTASLMDLVRPSLMQIADDDADPRAIMAQLSDEFEKHSASSEPTLIEGIEAYIATLPEPLLGVLRLRQEGKSPSEIAALMHTTPDVIRAVIVEMFVEMRLRIFA
jgi:hypothetical protein